MFETVVLTIYIINTIHSIEAFPRDLNLPPFQRATMNPSFASS